MEGFYRLCGISRQGFMQGRERLVATEKVMKAIEKEVSVYRSNKDRRAGSRSLYYNLSIGLRYGIGVNKFESHIEANVFVGSNSALVAPVTIGQGSTIGAGSTITRDVENEVLAVGRGKQRSISQWQRPVKKS